MSHESAKITNVHKYLPKDIINWKIAGGYYGANGIPDALYIGPNRALLIEYKNIQLPKRASTVITPSLTALQKTSLGKLYNLCFACGVIIFTNGGTIIMKTPREWENGVKLEDVTLISSYKEVADIITGAITGALKW